MTQNAAPIGHEEGISVSKDTVISDEWPSRPADCVKSPRSTSVFGSIQAKLENARNHLRRLRACDKINRNRSKGSRIVPRRKPGILTRRVSQKLAGGAARPSGRNPRTPAHNGQSPGRGDRTSVTPRRHPSNHQKYGDQNDTGATSDSAL